MLQNSLFITFTPLQTKFGLYPRAVATLLPARYACGNFIQFLKINRVRLSALLIFHNSLPRELMSVPNIFCKLFSFCTLSITRFKKMSIPFLKIF